MTADRTPSAATASRLCCGKGCTYDESLVSDLLYALKGLAKHELGEAFGDDAGLCWCDPFYERGPEWPGHDEACSWIRKLVARV